MMKRNEHVKALACALVALCVLCGLFFSARMGGDAIRFGQQGEKAVAAMRCLPVYSYLGTAQEDNSFLIDTTHGGEGYIAVTAKSERAVRAKLSTPSGAEIVYSVPNDGQVAYYPLSDGNGRYAIRLLKQAADGSGEDMYEPVLEGSCEAALFDEFQPFLRPSTYVWFTGYSDCVQTAAKLCAGESSDDRKIARIRDYVCQTLSYDETPAGSEKQTFIRDPDAIISQGKGICLDYAVLTAAMLRSQGIPTKVVYGRASQTDGLHAWNMAYSSSQGWLRLDTTSSDKGVAESFIADDSHYTDMGWY